MASQFSIQQFMARENFKLRLQKGEPVFLHETFYSLMQGYDALHLKADVQVGGTDQIFNIVAASRRIMSRNGQRPNTAVIVRILPGTDGEVKMSKSLGNHIPLFSEPADMYGRIMSLPDTAMRPYFELVTPLCAEEIEGMFRDLESGAMHPRDAKMRLAREVTAAFHSREEALRAEAEFDRVFRKKGEPEDMPVFRIRAPRGVAEILAESGLAGTRSEARRLISQRAVRAGGRIVADPEETIPAETVLQVGKRRFVRVIVESGV
jgi:tyrosyl-tRNA synthetase